MHFETTAFKLDNVAKYLHVVIAVEENMRHEHSDDSNVQVCWRYEGDACNQGDIEQQIRVTSLLHFRKLKSFYGMYAFDPWVRTNQMPCKVLGPPH
mmetsp:Transcript_93579/g.180457  ORF Transcript_93579/g.180457 Transcript_93579/m.180457 type:complete len:96 (-) Transcript_93579:2273-2560(-)